MYTARMRHEYEFVCDSQYGDNALDQYMALRAQACQADRLQVQIDTQCLPRSGIGSHRRSIASLDLLGGLTLAGTQR